MSKNNAAYVATKEMCLYCPDWVRCKDDDTKYCDEYLERVEELEAAK